jgi:hypothetical protein
VLESFDALHLILIGWAAISMILRSKMKKYQITGERDKRKETVDSIV